MGLDISLIRIVNEPVDEFCWLSTDDNPELLPEYQSFQCERQYEDGITESGFWYEELSYQRKGMDKSFYKVYEPDEFIFSKEDLLKMSRHVLPEYKHSFKLDFMDKLEEGANFIMTGY